jgi:LysR family transcriptional regulator, glycine cleavage system transcriptional activator
LSGVDCCLSVFLFAAASDRTPSSSPAGIPPALGNIRRFGSPGWWRRWLTEAGVENLDDGNQMGLVLGVQAMDVAVTLLGQGVAMVVPTFFAEELKSGRLVQPFAHVVEDGRSYFLIYPEARRRSRKIQLFRDWIIAEAEATRSALAVPA